MTATIERKYALTKLASGDYLLPSNDGLTVWRIARYTDGPSFGLEDWPRDRELWRYCKWDRQGHPASVEDIDDWDRWTEVGIGYDTRREAIEAALSSS